MKKMLFFSVMFFMGLAMSFAQVPLNKQLTYQTVVRNAQNKLVYNQSNVSVTVYVYNLNGTTVYYSETHTGLSTNPNGLLTLMVGGGTPASGNWDNIVWSDASIKTIISYDPGTGTVTIESDRAPVNGVPFAFGVDCSAVVGCVDDAIGNGGSTTNIAIDTLVENHLTPYEIKNCADVNSCVKTEIEDGGSDINHRIDTIVENHLVPYTIKNCDDVKDCVAPQIHDSLATYEIKSCADVMNCPDIKTMRDSIQTNHDEIEHLTTDLNSLETRVETFNTHVCDSIKDCVAAQISDSLNTNIRPNYYTKSETYNKTEVDALIPTVNNSTITFHQEGSTDQTITLNQSTNQTINIVTFSQKSDRFIIATAGQTNFTLTVPSGKTLETTNHLIQMYINGVYVGDTTDGVVSASGTTATYVPAVNGGYTLAKDDRVNFVFWVK